MAVMTSFHAEQEAQQQDGMVSVPGLKSYREENNMGLFSEHNIRRNTNFDLTAILIDC